MQKRKGEYNASIGFSEKKSILSFQEHFGSVEQVFRRGKMLFR